MKKNLVLGLVMALGCSFFVGCSSSSSVKAQALKIENQTVEDLSRYTVATFVPFEAKPNNGKTVDGSIGASFSDGLCKRIKFDYGKLFDEVRYDQPLRDDNEMIITGEINEYEGGNRFARGMLIGLGAASLKGRIKAMDGKTQEILFEAPFEKLWAWGGYMGMSKGIEEMVNEASASAAMTIASTKGWKQTK